MELLNPKSAPEPVGPYSVVVKSRGFIFLSGQIPIDKSNGQVSVLNIEEATHRVLKNISSILEEVGSSLEKVVKVTVYMTDMSGFQKFNQVYAQYFSTHRPARSVVEVS
ncbi:MAG TPA: reactive intermediate/imine deaminase, partial [Thermotogae bacterium]|nr:reactive intermediate/imine deaminase [Thermotogota bacterium]